MLIVEVLQTQGLSFNQTNHSSTTIIEAQTSDKKPLVVTEKTMIQKDADTKYLLHGLVGIIGFFLFVIVIQHYRKQKTPKEKHGASKIETQQSNQIGNDSVASGRFYQPLEPIYHEINEELLIKVKCFSNTLNDKDRTDFFSKHVPFIPRTECQTDNRATEQSTVNSVTVASVSDMLSRKLVCTENRSMYIDVIAE